jgi:hypothetical protein
MEVDFFAVNESKINWARMPRQGRLPELFCSENDLRTVAAFNSNESFALKQFGGTFQLAMGQMASRVDDTGVDDWNLGRWAWTLFKGCNGHSACIVLVSVPCNSDGEETVYRQHCRHLCKNGITECPRLVLLSDLKQQLLTWQQSGERLIVFLDANEDMTSGGFHDMLTGNGLHMREAVLHGHPDPRWRTTATFKSGDRIGRHPIDGCFVTPNLPTEAATWLAFERCPGDHRFSILDFKTAVLVGENVLKVVCPAAQRLSCAIPSAVTRYNRILSSFMLSHNMLQSLHSLYSARYGDFTPDQAQ